MKSGLSSEFLSSGRRLGSISLSGGYSLVGNLTAEFSGPAPQLD